MGKYIDCFFIGYNQIEFAEYEKMLQLCGKNSGVYRSYNLHFIQYQGTMHTLPEIYNLFNNQPNEEPIKKIALGDVFNGAISYLGTYLQRRGFSFDYVNSFQDDKDYLAKALQNDDILTIAITTSLYISTTPIIEVIKFIRKYNTKAKIIIGGAYIFARSRLAKITSMPLGVDYIINNAKGEIALSNIISHLKNNEPMHKIDNICYQDGDSFITTQKSEENEKLEDNMVDWSLFSHRIPTMVNVRTAISCPFSCSYCDFRQIAGKYQAVSLEAIERELDALKYISNIRHISFIDDTFNVPANRFKEILKLMIRKEYNFTWDSFFRCQFADDEMLQLMKESGCNGVFLGIESGSQKILDNMHKDTTIAKYLKGMELLKKYEIDFTSSFIIGFPGETEQTLQETIQFIERTEPDWLCMCTWYCSRFTPIWHHKNEYNLHGSEYNWSHSTMNVQQACDWLEKIYLSLNKTVYQSHFDFNVSGKTRLSHLGMSKTQIRDFVAAFNMGVKEKLKNPSHPEISEETVKAIKAALGKDN